MVENLTFAGALRIGQEPMAVLGGGAKAHGERRRAFARVRCALLIRLVYAVCFSLQDTGVSGAGKKPRQEVRCRDGHSDVFGMQLREGRERRRTLIVSRPECASALEKFVLKWPCGTLKSVCLFWSLVFRPLFAIRLGKPNSNAHLRTLLHTRSEWHAIRRPEGCQCG